MTSAVVPRCTAMTDERRPLALPHVDEGAPRSSPAGQAGLALVAVALLAPLAAFLGLLALMSTGGPLGMTALLAVLALGAAGATIGVLVWGSGRLSFLALMGYLLLAAALSLLLPWLMLGGLAHT